MNIHRILIAIALTVGLVLTPFEIAQGDTVYTLEDTFIDLGEMDKNKGDKDDVEVKISGSGRQGFVKFDLSSLPGAITAADIDRATLRIWVRDVSGEGGTINLHIVNGLWFEDTLTPANTPGFATDPFETLLIAEEDKGTYVSVDVTDAVKAWLTINNGLAFISESADIKLASKEYDKSRNVMYIEVGLNVTSCSLTECSAGGEATLTCGNNAIQVECRATTDCPTACSEILTEATVIYEFLNGGPLYTATACLSDPDTGGGRGYLASFQGDSGSSMATEIYVPVTGMASCQYLVRMAPNERDGRADMEIPPAALEQCLALLFSHCPTG